ncbi:hypothetical protein BC629DRAFT_1440631 [Irpex lacteus]|nr:hypothetical protein BC629DRAFT_1440631 [Irpex lacteus]
MSINNLNITKHPNLWFEDGNVILVAETTGFCVYQGMLTKHSEVFRERLAKQPPSTYLGMFRAMFKKSPETGTTTDSNVAGRCIVRLNDDRADDVALVLTCFLITGTAHTKLRSFYRNTEKAPFMTVAAALRLGTKYGFESMRQEALRRISVCYAKDLDDLHTSADDCSDPVKCPIAWESERDCIAVFHLARQLGLDDLVPAALYRCANDVSIEQLFEAAAVSNDDRLYMLSYQELQDCIQSRQELLAYSIKLSPVPSKIEPSCDVLSNEPVPEKKDASSWKPKKLMKNIVTRTQSVELFDSSKVIHSMDALAQGNIWPNLLRSASDPSLKSTKAQTRDEIWSRLRKYCAVSPTQAANDPVR